MFGFRAVRSRPAPSATGIGIRCRTVSSGAIDTEIQFLGLFDSVASVGASASLHEQFALWMFSGHCSWAAEILLPLPALVTKTVHLMAAHENRMNFP